MDARERKKIFVEFISENTVRFSASCSKCNGYKKYKIPAEKIKSKKISIICKCGAKSHYKLDFRKHRIIIASQRIPIRVENIEGLTSFRLNGFVYDVSQSGIGVRFDKSVPDPVITEKFKKGLKSNALIFPKGAPQLDQYIKNRKTFDLIDMLSRIVRYDKERRIVGIRFDNPEEIYNQRFNKWFRFTVCEFI